jgi:signal peptidase II
MISTLIALAAIVLLIAADQITKLLISSHFEVGQSMHVINGLLDFTYVQNRGAAFGMLSNQRWIFLILTTVLIAAIIFVWFKGYITHITGQLSAVLLIAGGIGNMIDRLTLGYVVDFIDVSPLFSFAVFNVADCCVTVGAVFMAIYMLFFMDESIFGKKENVSESE